MADEVAFAIEKLADVMTNDVGNHLVSSMEELDLQGSCNIADALLFIGKGLFAVADAIKSAHPFPVDLVLQKTLAEPLDHVASSLDEIAKAVDRVGDNIEGK
jgi:hypothetical protein